ncbi:MAG TPA: hypothetical protein VH539_15005 [Gemmatimonadaceae bacterium]
MLAPRARGALGLTALGLFALMAACSNGTEPTQSNLCDSSNPLTLGVGEVRTPIDANCVFVSGGAAGAEFAIVPFNGDTSYARTATLNFTSQGASTVSTPLQSQTFANGPSFNTLPSANSTSLVQPSTEFELRLRESERRLLKPLIPSARSWYRGRMAPGAANTRLSPSFSASSASWSVGDTVALNTRTGNTFADACQVPDLRRGRIVAITNTAIVVADTGNPTGGYTDAEYQTIGLQFDTVYTMDTGAFGAPSDIDNNGKIIMFFTRAVNELTPTGSQSVVGGFFYGRDLFPTADSPELGPGSGCPTSNVAEMFYLLVPDPNGVVNGNTRTKSFVQHLTNSTTAHEFQHLINGSRRLYVNTAATDFEVVWLNEGLSHIAEELLFYNQSAGLTPRQDVDSLDFKGNQKNVDSYNYNQQSNFGRFRSYLLKPSGNSPYAPNDSLATRGATWSFLRYAADHRGTSDADTWMKLDNSTTTGIANLQNVFGSNLTTIFRDWAVANIADDVASGQSAQWQHPSWNFRAVYDYIPSIKLYPLATVTVGDGSPLSVILNGGGAAYVRFTVAANQVGSVKWDAPPASVAMSIVRLK